MAGLLLGSDMIVVSDAEATTGWVSINGGTAAVDNDYKIQGTNCVVFRADASVGSGYSFVYSSTGSIANGNFSGNERHVFTWLLVTTQVTNEVYTNGGVGVVISSDTTPSATGSGFNQGVTNSKQWWVNGSDTDRGAGWTLYAVDPRSTPQTGRGFVWGNPDITVIKRVGNRIKTQADIKNTINNVFCDILRVGTGIVIYSGSSTDPITFAEVYRADNTGSSYGITVEKAGVTYGSGRLYIGTGSQANSTWFKETNKTMIWQPYPVSTSLYGFYLTSSANTTTNIQFGNYANSIASDGVTVSGASISGSSPSVWTLLLPSGSNVTASIYASNLSNLRYAFLNAASSLRSTTFIQSGVIIPSGATVDKCTFSSNYMLEDSASLHVTNASTMENITNCTFVNNGMAVRLYTSGTYNFYGHQFTGNRYDVDNASGGAITINALNSSNVTSYTSSVAGGTVTISNPKTLTLTNLVPGSEVRIMSAGTETELDGIESSGTSFVYSYTYAASTYIDIIVHNVEYIYYRVANYLLQPTDSTLPINQQYDRNYTP